MKRISLPLALAAFVTASLVHGQSPTATKPKTASTAAKPAVGTTAKSAIGTAARTGVVGGSAVKLPPGVPAVHGLVKSAFALRYQEIKIGTGPVAESNKLYKVHYTGWLASDGKKFDSSFDHPDKEPIQFPQGRGRVIPGWDQGFEGMRIGGKRRLFIPYQLAYGVMGRAPVIPAKSDLIFDIELVAVDDMPTQAMPGMPGARPVPRPGTTPSTSTPPPAPPKPAEPANPTNPANPANPAPNAAPPTTPTPPPPTTTQPTASPDKPANPAQPN
jgi:peptidylprolyl isomerase